MRRFLATTTMLSALLGGAMTLFAQMPDWKFFRDREGNTYFLDQAGKIRITDTGRRRNVVVSARGIDYYLHYGETLVGEHRPVEALIVLKSILALESDNNRVREAQVKARRIIEMLRKNNGGRFDAMNDDATPLLVRRDGEVEAIDDRMRYSFRAAAEVEVAVMRKKVRTGLDYRYLGVLYGMSRGRASEGSYDLMAAVDSEEFAIPFADLAAAEERWRQLIGPEDMTRQVVERTESRVIYRFRSGDQARFAGLEGIFVNGRMSHCVRIIASTDTFEKNGDLFRAIMKSFGVVSEMR